MGSESSLICRPGPRVWLLICIQDGDGICKSSRFTYGATRLNDGQNGAATASRQRRIALTVMNYFRRESRVDRGDHARFEEVRVVEGGWTSIVVVRTRSV